MLLSCDSSHQQVSQFSFNLQSSPTINNEKMRWKICLFWIDQSSNPKVRERKKPSLSLNVHHLANLSEFDSTIAQVFVFSSGLTAISDSSSVFVQWEVVSNTKFYKQSRWPMADTDCENSNTASGDFCCVPHHQLWWLACSLCQQWAQLLCASLWVC